MKQQTLSGIVTRFKGNGRHLGYPTANIQTETELKDGVYFGWADLGEEYHNQPAVMFVGTPTTVGDTERRLEAFLLDIPDRDYYDLLLKVKLVHYHRANQTFKTIDDLLEVMRQDEQAARRWFSSGNVQP